MDRLLFILSGTIGGILYGGTTLWILAWIFDSYGIFTLGNVVAAVCGLGSFIFCFCQEIE